MNKKDLIKDEVTKSSETKVENERSKPKPGEIYRHFKGHVLEVIDLALHTEDEVVMVVYRRIDDGSNSVFVRPLDMFMSKVDNVKYPDISQVYRFEKITDNMLTEIKHTPPEWEMCNFPIYFTTVGDGVTYGLTAPASMTIYVRSYIDNKNQVLVRTEIIETQSYDKYNNEYVIDATEMAYALELLKSLFNRCNDENSPYDIIRLGARASAFMSHIFERPTEISFAGETNEISRINEESLYLLTFPTKKYPFQVSISLARYFSDKNFGFVAFLDELLKGRAN